jgi:protein-disulfide isomerase
MASRKEQKEQARAARLAAEQELRERAQRMRRMQMLIGVVVLAAAVIVVAIVVSSSSKSPTPGLAKNQKQSTALYGQVNSLLAGIPQSGTTLGDPSAPVTLIYFGDLECPVCQEFTLTTLPQFITGQVKTGKVKVVYRSFCTATCKDYSNGQSIFNDQQVAAYSAGKQNLFWQYAELFYHQQGAEGSGYVTPTFINKIAEQIPDLKNTTWTADRKDPDLLAQVEADEKTAANDGLQGTPSLILKGPKGETLAPETVPSYAQLVSVVKSVS